MHLHLQTLGSHLSQIEEKWCPKEKGKGKVESEKLKPVLIKPPIISSKGFNTNTLLNDNFIDKLTQKLGSLNLKDSLRVIGDDNIQK